ncbi:MAG: 16S rRNA (cytosine(967)-C(5))-methyltransferase RsmB [Thermodesulfobacteriota bacterium]|nr:16S rRNA (cytosine(967)-C(5))-methyltransferase RsmB [Thermodesulfobacteriota bacterium]
MSVTPRNLALKAINSLDNGTGFPDQYLKAAFLRYPHLSERDRAFAVNLVQGTLRWRLRIDWVIGQAVRFPFRKIEPLVLNILRIGLYQILFMDRVPESAAVDEAVKQAKGFGRRHVAGFVNGILRNVCRQKHSIAFPERETDSVRYLSVFYSYPAWLVKKWIREVGLGLTEQLLAAGNEIPGLVIRTNTLKIDRPGLIKHLDQEGLTGRPTRYSPDGVELEGLKGPVSGLKSFKEGLFQVQGEAAQMCSYFFSPSPGDRILDICAGLGGKSTHVAQLIGDSGFILALDMNYNRLVSLKSSSRRLGTGSIRTVVADAAGDLSSLLHSSFDKIIVDAPCSALGTISKHPDGKWTKNEGDIERLSILQRKILNSAAPLLREGGKMLYLTCTISRQENEDMVSGFLKENRHMELGDLKDRVPEWGMGLIDDHGFFRTYPHVNGMDGFFGALLIKKSNT